MPNIQIKFKNFVLLAGALIFLNIFIWQNIFLPKGPSSGFYFLDVGQGDSELAVFTSGIKVLTDAGPNKGSVQAIGKVLGPLDAYLDIGLISHPQADHYGGFLELLEHYDFGAFIWNGRKPEVPTREWNDLLIKLQEKNIPLFALGAGDKIFSGEDKIEILSPDKKLLSGKEVNETGLVEKITLAGIRAIFAADISKRTENKLLVSGIDISAEVLKVAHHGSKYSSGEAFLKAVNPTVAAIEVGKKNRYGHPTAVILGRLKNLGTAIMRTDIQGTISVWPEKNSLLISSAPSP